MDSNLVPLLEKSHAIRRDQIHGIPGETRLNLRNAALGEGLMKTLDGGAQRTIFVLSRRPEPESIRRGTPKVKCAPAVRHLENSIASEDRQVQCAEQNPWIRFLDSRSTDYAPCQSGFKEWSGRR